MSNHKNKNRTKRPDSNPTPEQVRAAREAAGLTQTEAGKIVYCSLRGWQEWESGNRRMHPAFWELFAIKTRTEPLPFEEEVELF